MIVIDTSALVAILLQEHDASKFAQAIQESEQSVIKEYQKKINIGMLGL